MLQSLHVHNFALIEDAKIDFAPGFNIFTGETGAGAYLLRILKAHCALNLDGGGSTTLWVNGQVVNHPSDNKKFDNKGERKVHNIIAVRRLTNP